MNIRGDLVVEGVQGIKLGVVAIFGIIVPGIWFCASCSFYLAYLFGAHTLADYRSIAQMLLGFTGPYLAWILAFMVVYVTGSVLRILPPDTPDSWSLRRVRVRDIEARIEWPDRFPYKSLPAYLRYRGLKGLAMLVPWDTGEPNTPTSQVGPRSKTFLHFVKLYIALHNPSMANHLARQEAFIRLLSGVFYAVALSTPVLLVGAIAQRSLNAIALVSAAIGVFNWVIVYGILVAFHYQRLRELVMILSVYFLIGSADRSPYTDSRSRDSGTPKSE